MRHRPAQRQQHVHARRVDPVGVVDHHDRRLVRAVRSEPVDEDRGDVAQRLFGCLVGEVEIVREREPEEPRQPAEAPIIVSDHGHHDLADPLERIRRVRSCRERGIAQERSQERGERRHRRQFGARELDRSTRVQAVDQFVGEPSLADPRLAGDRDEHPLGGLVGDAPFEHLEFRAPADHPGRAVGARLEARDRLGRSDDTVDPDRTVDPPDLLLTERLDLDVPADEMLGGVTDEHLAGFGQALDPRCDVRCLADDVVALDPFAAAHLGDDDETGVDPDPCVHVHPELLPELGTTCAADLGRVTTRP